MDINITCEICKNADDYSTYFIGQGKCTDCWNYFKKVGSWRNVQRNRAVTNKGE
jgi:hypothetical protein